MEALSPQIISPQLFGIVCTAISTVFAGMTTVITFLWVKMNKSERLAIKDRKKCDEDREKLWSAIVEIQKFSCTLTCPERQSVPLPKKKF